MRERLSLQLYLAVYTYLCVGDRYDPSIDVMMIGGCIFYIRMY